VGGRADQGSRGIGAQTPYKIIAQSRRKSLADLVKADVAAKIARARSRRNAEKKSRIPYELERKVTDKKTRDELRAHGFKTTKRGVIVDRPRDIYRKKVPGSRMEVLKGGVVKTRVAERRDYVYGFTKAEKKEFAKNPGKTEKNILERLKERFPTLRRSRKISVSLQWGAYQGTKEFNPHYFSAKYLLQFLMHHGKPDKTHRKIDALTGLHIVVHIPKGK
jgi:hypothetical protein